MKKELTINKNNLILLEMLYTFDSLGLDNDLKKDLYKFRNLVEKKTFGNFFNNGKDITKEECILKYTFED